MSETAALWQEIGALKARLDVVEKRPAAPAGGSGGASAPSGGGAVASDYDLDSEYGDPAVRKNPSRWTGADFAGCKMSECPPEYLDAVASLFDWMADKDDEAGRNGETYLSKKTGQPVAKSGAFKRKDAARARGWAKRKRDGWAAPAMNQRQAAPANATQPKDDYADNYGDDDTGLPF
jgi:hypothetical protein